MSLLHRRETNFAFCKFHNCLIKAALLQVARSSEWSLPLATGLHLLWGEWESVKIWSPSNLRLTGFLHKLLLWVPSPPPQAVQGQSPGGGWLIMISERQARHKYLRLILISKSYSTALPAWWSAASHGIGVGGHWGRIDRARSEC